VTANAVIKSIPTIDVTDIDSPELATRQRIAKELLDACSKCGFFYMKGHGLSEVLQEETFDIMKRFFALDLDSKMDAHVQKNPAIRGYEPIGETQIDPRTRGGKMNYTCQAAVNFNTELRLQGSIHHRRLST